MSIRKSKPESTNPEAKQPVSQPSPVRPNQLCPAWSVNLGIGRAQRTYWEENLGKVRARTMETNLHPVAQEQACPISKADIFDKHQSAKTASVRFYTWAV